MTRLSSWISVMILCNGTCSSTGTPAVRVSSVLLSIAEATSVSADHLQLDGSDGLAQLGPLCLDPIRQRYTCLPSATYRQCSFRAARRRTCPLTCALWGSSRGYASPWGGLSIIMPGDLTLGLAGPTKRNEGCHAEHPWSFEQLGYC